MFQQDKSARARNEWLRGGSLNRLQLAGAHGRPQHFPEGSKPPACKKVIVIFWLAQGAGENFQIFFRRFM